MCEEREIESESDQSTEKNRGRFTIYAMFILTTLVAVFAGASRFLADHPVMLGPILITGFFVSILLAPAAVSKWKSPAGRVSAGCCLVPVAYVFFAIGYVLLVYLLRAYLRID
ncbi:MAG TPA: hypothetical protein DDW52_26440 [Planctomycetaceae bacterium]|nr:hypothetical protein [Planctomycetaceae bacterium]